MKENNYFKWMIKNMTIFCENTANLLNTVDSDMYMRSNIANFLANLAADKDYHDF